MGFDPFDEYASVDGSGATWTDWSDRTRLPFFCAWCKRFVVSHKGWRLDADCSNEDAAYAVVAVCPLCDEATVERRDGTVPPSPTARIGGLPSHVAQLFREAQLAEHVGAHTAAALCCRSLISYTAVHEGAKWERPENFATHIEFLIAKDCVPKTAKAWLTHIKDRGNAACHNPAAPATKADARALLDLSEILLRVVFEFPAMVAEHLKPDVSNTNSQVCVASSGA